jgi:hypothetical protein
VAGAAGSKANHGPAELKEALAHQEGKEREVW